MTYFYFKFFKKNDTLYFVTLIKINLIMIHNKLIFMIDQTNDLEFKNNLEMNIYSSDGSKKI